MKRLAFVGALLIAAAAGWGLSSFASRPVGTDGHGAVVTAETQPASDSSTKAATTAFAQGLFPANLAVFPAVRYGAFFDGIHDDAPGISNAIAAAATAGGGTVQLPRGVGLLASNVANTHDNVHIVGGGVPLMYQQTTGFQYATVLKWIGAAGGTMMTVGPVQNDAASNGSPRGGVRVSNASVQGITFDGRARAGIDLQVQSVAQSDFTVGVTGFLQKGVVFTTVWLASRSGPTDGSAVEVNDNQNDTGTIYSTQNTIVATTVAVDAGAAVVRVAGSAGFLPGMQVKIGAGLYVVGDVAAGQLTLTSPVSSIDGTSGNAVRFAPNAGWFGGLDDASLPVGYHRAGAAAFPQLWVGNTSENTFRNLRAYHYSGGDAFVFDYADHNHVPELTAYTFPGSYGLVFNGGHYSGVNAFANRMGHVSASVYARGVGFVTPSFNNVIEWFDQADVAALPVIESAGGATLLYTSDQTLTTHGQQADQLTIGGSSVGDTNIPGMLTVSNTGAALPGILINNIAGTTAIQRDTHPGFPVVDTISVAGKTVWQMGKTTDAQTGGNAGASWVLAGYSDTGAFLGNWIFVARANGAITMPGAVTVGGLASAGAVTAEPGFRVGARGPTWTSGNGAPRSDEPKGSFYTRQDGTIGSTLYVSQGAGRWNAVPGV